MSDDVWVIYCLGGGCVIFKSSRFTLNNRSRGVSVHKGWQFGWGTLRSPSPSLSFFLSDLSQCLSVKSTLQPRADRGSARGPISAPCNNYQMCLRFELHMVQGRVR